MNDVLVSVLTLFGGLAVLAGVAFFLGRRARKNGNLFTGRAGRSTRIFAFIMGVVFGGFFIYEWLNFHEYQVEMPILAFALIAYSLGWNQLIDALQKLKK